MKVIQIVNNGKVKFEGYFSDYENYIRNHDLDADDATRVVNK